MNNRNVIYYGGSLAHHGILGMKWGVWNDETRARYSGSSASSKDRIKKTGEKVVTYVKNKSKEAVSKVKSMDKAKKKKVMAIIIGSMTVAAAGVYVAKNPAVVKAAGKALKKVGSTIANGLKEGVKEGLKEGPKTLSKAVVKGSFIVAGKKIADKILGQDKSDTIFKANDKDKIGKFWNKSQPDDEKKLATT